MYIFFFSDCLERLVCQAFSMALDWGPRNEHSGFHLKAKCGVDVCICGPNKQSKLYFNIKSFYWQPEVGITKQALGTTVSLYCVQGICEHIGGKNDTLCCQEMQVLQGLYEQLSQVLKLWDARLNVLGLRLGYLVTVQFSREQLSWWTLGKLAFDMHMLGRY